MRLAVLVIIACAALFGQTSSGTPFGPGCGSNCTYSYFQSVGNHSTDSVFLYATGGGGSSYSSTCPPTGSAQEICGIMTASTQQGFQSFAPLYTLTSTTHLPEASRNLACFLSYGATNLPGNWNDVWIMWDSFGGIVAAPVVGGPVGKYLTDGDSHCGSSNTNWKITHVFDSGGTLTFPDYCNLTGKAANCTGWWGGQPSTAQANQQSLSFWLSTMQAKGFPQYFQFTGGCDTTTTVINQNLFEAAVIAGGYTGSWFRHVTVLGYQHPSDFGSVNSGDSWPTDLTNANHEETSFCATSSAGNCTADAAYGIVAGQTPFTSGYPLCGTRGFVGRAAFAAARPQASGASGGSGAAGGSW